MKLTLLTAVAIAGLFTTVARADVYSGNAATGFGGVLGNASLTVTDANGVINFSITTGQPFSDNVIVFYIDSTAGGFGDTSTFADNADGGRTAISGFRRENPDAGDADTRTLATFASGFTANYAVALQPATTSQTTFAGLFQLATGGDNSLVYLGSANAQNPSGNTFTFSISATDIGLTTVGDAVRFSASLISGTAFRSNETIGASSTTNGQNPGFTGTLTYTGFESYAITSIPEPSTVSLVALAAAAAVIRVRARRRQQR